ncbi:hypothetical protein [Aeromicrobium sp. IC_218]|uniref:hypothetical protein n=1 Tax=Aeromicrobium sp. IC_218 TaxID=2545468 RepID=UPI0010407259|nr:hypothetical protein [Aeromicrobium sp. IC_218]TCI98830.1 hypothetical protein E0W78_08735 [Aeromicrobium sp. IC_218]
MANGDQAENEIARQLYWARIVSSPDSWRTRATSAGGFLSAAAAASLLGLGTVDDPNGAQAVSVSLATILYVAAVGSFLAASVWPSPSRTISLADDNCANEVFEYVADESKPIRKLVIGGGIASVLALLATAVSAMLIVLGDQSSSVQVTFRDDPERTAAQHLCSKLPETFRAEMARGATDDLAEITLQPSHCAGRAVTMTIPRQSIIVSEAHQ